MRRIYLIAVLFCVPLGAAAQDISSGNDSGSSETGQWSLYFPVHMPGLEISQSVEGGDDVELKADILDLAQHANSFFALGARYEFSALNRMMWFDINGWYGGYDMDMHDLTAGIDAVPPAIVKELLDVNLEMKQAIIQGDAGVWLIQDWHKLDLGLTGGLRYYYQEIEVFGKSPMFVPDCGRFGCFEAMPFSEGETTHLTEITLGVVAKYQWHAKNALSASFSLGHEGSSRTQLINTLAFKQAWFFSLGWRRDEFENDGVNIIESGVYFDIGKTF
ncbi:MAG: hypothetical protein V7709_05480 [Halioglobus sp.]